MIHEASVKREYRQIIALELEYDIRIGRKKERATQSKNSTIFVRFFCVRCCRLPFHSLSVLLSERQKDKNHEHSCLFILSFVFVFSVILTSILHSFHFLLTGKRRRRVIF